MVCTIQIESKKNIHYTHHRCWLITYCSKNFADCIEKRTDYKYYWVQKMEKYVNRIFYSAENYIFVGHKKLFRRLFSFSNFLIVISETPKGYNDIFRMLPQAHVIWPQVLKAHSNPYTISVFTSGNSKIISYSATVTKLTSEISIRVGIKRKQLLFRIQIVRSCIWLLTHIIFYLSNATLLRKMSFKAIRISRGSDDRYSLSVIDNVTLFLNKRKDNE